MQYIAINVQIICKMHCHTEESCLPLPPVTVLIAAELKEPYRVKRKCYGSSLRCSHPLRTNCGLSVRQSMIQEVVETCTCVLHASHAAA